MNYAILLFAGNSTRFSKDNRKQFYLINNKPLYQYSLFELNASPLIDQIILVTNEDKVYEIYQEMQKHKFKKVKAVIGGGKTRTDSVRKALKSLFELQPNDNDIILIHDAARPLLNSKLVETSINETKTKKATTFALKTYDTLVTTNKNYEIVSYLNRDAVFHLQTPQTFEYSLIKEAYKKNQQICNDDTEMIFKLNKKVFLLKGDENLFKITTFNDIEKLKNILKQNKTNNNLNNKKNQLKKSIS